MKTNKQKNKHFEEYKDKLLTNFDELNTIKLDYNNKKRLKKRYERYKGDYLITLYIAFLLSKEMTLDNALDISTLIATSELYDVLLEDLEDMRDIGYTSAYEVLATDCPSKEIKSKLKGKLSKLKDNTIAETIIKNSNMIARDLKLANKTDKEPNLDNALKTMSKAWLNLNTNGKTSGYVERQAEIIYNEGYLQACKDNGIKEVQFVAIEDNVTTEMCKSLDGQKFVINGKNKFRRYLDSTQSIEDVEVYGLVQGINLPPIEDHFHWCRSWIQAI